MANPIAFTPKPVDPKLELQHRLASAPSEHAEALLAAYDLLEEAHRKGVLDALHGAVGARDTIAGIAAKYAAEPVSVNAIRNFLALSKVFGTLDPEPIAKFSDELSTARAEHRKDQPPPTLWQLFKRMRQPESRRGLALLTSVLAALGRAAK